MSPALIPNPDTYKDNLENSKVKTRYITQANGVKAPNDEFHLFKNGFSIDKNRHRGILVEVFGCKSCRWVNTDLCPHKGDVTHMKPHANGVCSQRFELAKSLHDEGVKMTGKALSQVKALMDAEYFDKYMQDQALMGKRDMQDCFPWVKLRADILKDMRKQNEGSKITMKKESLDPLQFAKLLRETKSETVDVNPSPSKGDFENDE